MSEFFDLKQGDLTVTEYEMRFESLAHFATTQLIDDVFKGTRFESGLRSNICRALANFLNVSYCDIVTRSLAVEANEVEIKEGRSRSIKHSPPLNPFSYHHPILRGLYLEGLISQGEGELGKLCVIC